MSDITHATEANRNLITAWATIDNIRPTPDREIDYRLATAQVKANLATAAAIREQTAAVREQTAVFRQLLDEDRAAARDLAEKAGA